MTGTISSSLAMTSPPAPWAACTYAGLHEIVSPRLRPRRRGRGPVGGELEQRRRQAAQGVACRLLGFRLLGGLDRLRGGRVGPVGPIEMLCHPCLYIEPRHSLPKTHPPAE